MSHAAKDFGSDAPNGTIQVLKNRICVRILWINALRLADPIDDKARGNSLLLPNYGIHGGVR
jgi:hypothetical protein